MDRYGRDVLAHGRKARPVCPAIDAELGLVVEDDASGFCGAVVGFQSGAVILEDRHGKRRLFPLSTGVFLLDGSPVTLRRPASTMGTPTMGTPTGGRRTASGSRAVPGHPAKVAKASRIWVEGRHDAELVERIWGDDLRVEAVVVEPLDGIDHLQDAVLAFGPGPGRRLGVLVDHLVAGTKEARIASAVAGPHVLITGHPYVDIWQAVRPRLLGIEAWPVIAPGLPWKEAVCAALGVAEPGDLWRRILSKVHSYRDVEAPLIGAVERLIDHVTADPRS